MYRPIHEYIKFSRTSRHINVVVCASGDVYVLLIHTKKNAYIIMEIALMAVIGLGRIF